MVTPVCPQCRQTIPGEDVNVAKDVAFCKRCNAGSRLSALINMAELDAGVDVDRPPEGAWHSRDGLSVRFGATHRSIGTMIGVLAMSLFWNGIVSVFVLLALGSTLRQLNVPTPSWFPAPTMEGGGAMTSGMTIFLWIFLTPFMLVGAGLISAVLSSIWGRTEVKIEGADGRIFNGIGPLGYTRRFDTEAVDSVSLVDQPGENKTKHIVIGLKGERHLKFGSMLRDDRMKFVASVACKQLARI